jgi:broad specificity phosphatase PhoE
MKIILLRHEERYSDIGFFSNLTENGILNSYNLSTQLKQYNIDHIFSSPFIRTIQTIFPYCYKYDEKINIEYGLYEYIHNLYFLLGQWYYNIKDIKDNDLHLIINKKYKTIVTKDDFTILEIEEDLEKRVKKFIDYLKENYNDKTILLVSHMGVINKIKDLYVKKTDMRDLFKMGHYEIYNI